ncbi:acetate--CoA ligase [Piscirickettsia salmonis]|uniref:acetate--CoA ligase n=1 Tax=Piscirickettsia salmonis TaxID=1238 RepID=UPI00375178D9
MPQLYDSPDHARFPHALIQNQAEYQRLCQWAKEDYEGFWAHQAKTLIDWKSPFKIILDESNAPAYHWFTDGTLNVSEQCLDRHLNELKNKVALLFEGERGDRQAISYLELYYRVCQTANMLKEEFKLEKGDRVVLYMPMIPEAVVMMLACARLGVIHSIVFGGFSAEALYERIIDAKAKLVITADGGFRHGQPYLLKPTVDQALGKGCDSVEAVLVVRRNHQDVKYQPGRDFIYDLMVDEYETSCPAVELASEDPLFLLYTSGSTGKPKGVQHAQAGYILWAQLTLKWVFDLQESDTFWCTADIGWITGHTYTVYGPLALGATTLIYEGVPTFPDAGRFWRIIERYQVNQFYTAPTAIRLLHKEGESLPQQFDLSTLRVLGTVGEPINPEAWQWYYESVGNSHCAIVDTWWQTETGGHLITPLPAWGGAKPGCAMRPLPGIFAEILTPEGQKAKPDQKGLLCITRPWPSMLRTIWGDYDRFINSYFSEVNYLGKAVYFSGDGALYDQDGHIWVTGRVDDVVNVSGHRLGTAEVESAIAKHEVVAEVAVVSRQHEIKGEAIVAFIVLRDLNYNQSNNDERLALHKSINAVVRAEIGAIALVENFYVVSALPKTRSGKIVRRLLRSIVRKEDLTQDTSTLENPAIIADLEWVINTTNT